MYMSTKKCGGVLKGLFRLPNKNVIIVTRYTV